MTGDNAETGALPPPPRVEARTGPPADAGSTSPPGPLPHYPLPRHPLPQYPPAGGTTGSSGARDRPEPRAIDARLAGIVIVAAIVIDLALRRPPWNNIAGSVGVIVLAVALVGSGRLEARGSKVSAGLAGILGGFLWLRTDPVLVSFDIIAALALSWIAVVHGRGPSVWDSGPLRLGARAIDTIIMSFETLADGASELVARKHRFEKSRSATGELTGALVRGAIIALPILLVLGLLLTSADAVFASFFDIGWGLDVGTVVGHAVLLTLGGFTMIVLLRTAGQDRAGTGGELRYPRLGRVEALVVLIALDLLFAGFAAAQILALTGGADSVLRDAGLTFKQYARQGFFQLLWVAGLTLVVLISANTMTRHLERGRRAVIWASVAAVALTIMIVVVAVGRLWLYVADDGLTPLRFYSSVFSAWIGVVFVLVALRILGVRPDRAWLTTSIGLSGVLVLIGLNIASPQAVIMSDNLNRDQPSILFHMEKMTADGNLTLVDGWDRLSPDLREQVQTKFCRRQAGRQDSPTGLSYNRSERRLDDRVSEVCG